MTLVSEHFFSELSEGEIKKGLCVRQTPLGNNVSNSVILLTLDEGSSLACCDYLTLKTCAAAFALLDIPYISAQLSIKRVVSLLQFGSVTCGKKRLFRVRKSRV